MGKSYSIKTLADINLLSNVSENGEQRVIVIGMRRENENHISTSLNEPGLVELHGIVRNSCAILWFRTTVGEPLCRLLIDTVSPPRQTWGCSSRVGFPDGSEPAEKCQAAGRHLCF